MKRFPGMYLTDDQIRAAINLQVLARFRPSKITFIPNWFPRSQLDRFIWRQLLIGSSWSLGKLAKVLPFAWDWYLNKFAKTVETHG